MHPDLPVSGDAEHQVSIALVRLLRLRNGTLWHNPLVDPLLRAALLIDWALSGRLVERDTELELDTTPSGRPAADALLARIAAEPERPLTSWLRGEQPTLAELVEPLVATGVLVPVQRWRRIRYRDPHEDELPPLRTRLLAVIRENQQAAPAVIALAVLAQLLGVLSDGASAADDDVVYRAGNLTWLLVAVRDFGFERLRQVQLKGSLSFGDTGI